MTFTLQSQKAREKSSRTDDKHKIFLYKEDFEKFAEGLEDAVKYIKARLNGSPEAAVKGEPAPEDVEISAEDKDIF